MDLAQWLLLKIAYMSDIINFEYIIYENLGNILGVEPSWSPLNLAHLLPMWGPTTKPTLSPCPAKAQLAQVRPMWAPSGRVCRGGALKQPGLAACDEAHT